MHDDAALRETPAGSITSQVSEACNEEALVAMLLTDGRAMVTIQRGEACHSCAARGACRTLGGMTDSFDLVVENDIGAAPGDRVALVLPESAVIKASALVYLLPAATLLAGAFCGSWLAASRGWPADPTSIAGGVTGLVSGLLATRAISRLAERGKTFVPRMTRIAPRAAADPEP